MLEGLAPRGGRSCRDRGAVGGFSISRFARSGGLGPLNEETLAVGLTLTVASYFYKERRRKVDTVRHQVSWRQMIGIPLNVFFFLLLMVMAWGSWEGFFAHPVRVGVVVIHLLMLPVMTFFTAGRSRGVRHRADSRLFFPLLVMHSLFTAWVLPYMDVRNVWVLPGGDALRWVGLTFLAEGALLRAWPMMVLGHRFATVVAIQSGHRLHTTGIYGLIRHPSYLGILLMDLGFAFIFRSAIALLVLPVVFWMFNRRMEEEEALLVDEFGEEYRAYAGKTPRLLPGIY